MQTHATARKKNGDLTQKTIHALMQLLSEPQGTKPHVLLGLSGGPDSVFLFHTLLKAAQQNALTFSAAHFNHQWRESAEKDLLFCAKLCKKHSINFISGYAQDYQTRFKPSGSKEDLGRRMRRAFLQETLDNIKADAIALAHHAQDQEETFIIRLMRGSTLDGLTCMKPKESLYIRPLLSVRKETMLEYLAQHNHDFVIDPSNESDLYLRNRIRNTVIPALKSSDDRFGKKFADTLHALTEENDFLNELTEKTCDQLFSNENGTWIGTIADFSDLHPVTRRRTLIAWLCHEKASFSPSASFVKEALRFLLSGSNGSHELSKSWKLIKKAGRFWIEKQPK